MELEEVTLEDKYRRMTGRVYLTGTQALVRLVLMQHERDKLAGLDTAGFVSGYRGSPLGGLDQALWRASEHLARAQVHFQPGVNEDLAATAVWGSQQVNLFPGARHDGVFAMWYGKGPGVDRSGDAFRHANAAGTARHGGVLAVAGDDHACKSSTLPHQTEFAFVDAMIPVLAPADVQDILDLGLYGWALSRFSGCWVALKTIAETIDSSASVAVDPERVRITLPEDFTAPPGGLNIRWPDAPLEQEARLATHKLEAVRAFARANRLDRAVLDGARRRVGIVTTGKAFLDVMQALEDLGIDAARAADLGLCVYKVAMPWPLEGEGLRAFAAGLEEVLVVEEKRALLETQVKEHLYVVAGAARPRVVGKFDEAGAALLPSNGELSASMVARAIASRIARIAPIDALRARLAYLDARDAALAATAPAMQRTPHFCSGCPHNTSTVVPEGSRALAGIGCHFMATWMDRHTETFTQMGGEGASWIGQAPFTETGHVFQNLGDGTYFHSGVLAIRAAVAAGVNITYKILYNDAVAMTGGQPMDGALDVARLSRQLEAEGVRRIVVVSDDLEKYDGHRDEFAERVSLRERDDLDAVQRELRECRGVSALIYDQTCAAEKRRRRKRGRMPDPAKRVVINELVCEGCGDCGTKSNCLSVVPLETEFGRKRAIDQSACNKDFSCLKGFCPSFVTVHGARLRRPQATAGATLASVLPDPAPPEAPTPYNILITGVGGTGVVTIGALLGMAAHLEGKGCSVLDQTGLAQKFGAVVSHVRIAERAEDIHAVRIGTGAADLMLGCDMVVAASADALARLDPERSHAVVNRNESMPATFTRAPDLEFPAGALEAAIGTAAGAGHAEFVEATRLATALLGDSIATNLFMVGYAYQLGLLPLGARAIERAIELNGVAVEANRAAFAWGRRAVHDPAAVRRTAGLDASPARPESSLDELLARRKAFLAEYQDQAYAERYAALVETVHTVEAKRVPGHEALARAVARGYFKLMAYKDEYEVARLYTEAGFRERLAERFEGELRLRFHLAPPLLARRDPRSGEPRKREYGPWILRVFKVLSALRGLRGTRWDPFGRSAERRRERALVVEYERLVGELLEGLDAGGHALAVEIASLAEDIRGFGHIKSERIDSVKRREARLLEDYRARSRRPDAA